MHQLAVIVKPNPKDGGFIATVPGKPAEERPRKRRLRMRGWLSSPDPKTEAVRP